MLKGYSKMFGYMTVLSKIYIKTAEENNTYEINILKLSLKELVTEVYEDL
jgi:hypothetical protein